MAETKDFEQLIREKGMCCICTKPMKDSKFISIAQLDKKAAWKYPTWNNFYIIGLEDRAMAVVCDGCHEAAEVSGVSGRVKYAIEFRGEEVIMHDIEELVDAEPISPIVKYARVLSAISDPQNPITGEPYLFTGTVDGPRYGPESKRWMGFRICGATYCPADLLVDRCTCMLKPGHEGQHECECGNKW